MTAPKVTKHERHGDYEGVSFTILVCEFEGGRCLLRHVNIRGDGLYEEPIERTFATVDEAADAGIKFACKRIDG